MAKLNILGAQRVKTLISILNKKQNDELVEINRGISWAGLQKQAKEETGFDVIEKQYNEARVLYQNRYNELQAESVEKQNQIKSKYKEKENKLWLCETLEEAKQIVGIE